MGMSLEIKVASNAAIVTNVQEVARYYLDALKNYEGLVATEATVKEDKKKCAEINKLKDAVAKQRIAFDRAIEEQPDVKAVHNALRSIELACDAVRDPYWASCKAIEDARKPPEDRFVVSVNLIGITSKQLDAMKKKWAKDGIVASVIDMAVVKDEGDK